MIVQLGIIGHKPRYRKYLEIVKLGFVGWGWWWMKLEAYQQRKEKPRAALWRKTMLTRAHPQSPANKHPVDITACRACTYWPASRTWAVLLQEPYTWWQTSCWHSSACSIGGTGELTAFVHFSFNSTSGMFKTMLSSWMHPALSASPPFHVFQMLLSRNFL